jgi:anti-anti-sigma factor
MASAEHLRQRFEGYVAASHGDVVVDCHALTFIDSSGIKVLLDVAVAATRLGRGFVATSVQPQCRRTFQLAGVDQLLGIT